VIEFLTLVLFMIFKYKMKILIEPIINY